jgi:hypothetical protein
MNILNQSKFSTKLLSSFVICALITLAELSRLVVSFNALVAQFKL